MFDHEQDVERFGNVLATLGEGLVVDAATNTVHQVDIDGHKYIVLDRSNGEELEAHEFDEPVSSVNLTTNPDWVVLTIGADVWYYNRKTRDRIAIAEDVPGAGERLNDCRAVELNGKVKLAWGGVDRSGRNSACFGTVDADGNITRLLDGIGISNGFAVNGDALVYVDSLHPDTAIRRFVIEADGSLTEGEPLPIELPAPTHPDIAPSVLDGLWMDTMRWAWIAVNAASCVIKVDLSSGAIEETISIPTHEVTTVAIDEQGTMFVATARERHAQANPPVEPNEAAGATYRVDVGTPGVAPVRFPAPKST